MAPTIPDRKFLLCCNREFPLLLSCVDIFRPFIANFSLRPPFLGSLFVSSLLIGTFDLQLPFFLRCSFEYDYNTIIFVVCFFKGVLSLTAVFFLAYFPTCCCVLLWRSFWSWIRLIFPSFPRNFAVLSLSLSLSCCWPLSCRLCCDLSSLLSWCFSFFVSLGVSIVFLHSPALWVSARLIFHRSNPFTLPSSSSDFIIAANV